MKPNTKSLLTGALAVALLWAVVAFTGGTATDTAATGTATDATTEAAREATPSSSGAAADAEITNGDKPAPAEEPAHAEDPNPADDTPAARYSDLATVTRTDLPIEAIDTLELIATDGPYPYEKDDSVFQNREGILPDEARGHYREYTVATPGEGDRGARRIVAGADGALFYTDDHYDSFREIVAD